ncbi:MAG: penicillin-binding transpeptidase domain-containing protein [Planctomycetota bacterium]
MSRDRSTSTTRIGVLAGVFGVALLIVLAHLFGLMVQDREVWARRSYENRWAFRSVPSLRGRILDRDGVVLARDEATTRVSVHYLRFRLWHCVGAAVHGASVCRELELPEGTYEDWAYDYGVGPRGALAAARDLFSIPVGLIEPGRLDKKVTAQLATYATTVLSQLGDVSRRQAYRAMREAAQSGARLGIGDVLDVPREALAARFLGRYEELLGLRDRLLAERSAPAAGGTPSAATGAPPSAGAGGGDGPDDADLLEQLEELRVASFRRERLQWTDDEGRAREGSLREELRVQIAEEVSFDVAAALRVDGQRYAGIAVEPSVRRVRSEVGGAALDALIGRVNWWDRTLLAVNQLDAALRDAPRRDTSVADYVEQEMPAGWAEQLVPEGIVEDQARLAIVDEARRRYERELLVRERRGVTGFEAKYDDELRGQLGMRFVEHDGKRREHSLWSHLEVESGADVRVSIDADLQRIAQGLVEAFQVEFADEYRRSPDPQRRRDALYVEAALAVIDAKTGDVLACAGAPVYSESARHLPGVMWIGNGSIGSVAKPFVLVEQLESARLGRPHTPLSEIRPCEGAFRYQGQRLGCARAHWGGGQTPRSALAKSCNCFFYQLGIGLGDEAVRRAYERFGLVEAASGAPYRATWQPSVGGISTSPASIDGRRLLPSRAIGYGVQVTPLFVARAYAGLATGALPQLGVRLGEARSAQPIDAAPETLELVRAGLDDVVQVGTARDRAFLAQLGVRGKTGTAERTRQKDNNVWFAGYLPAESAEDIQLAFCSVVYFVQNENHGGDTAGDLAERFLRVVDSDAALRRRYLPR